MEKTKLRAEVQAYIDDFKLTEQEFIDKSQQWYKSLSPGRFEDEPRWHYEMRRKDTDEVLRKAKKGQMVFISKMAPWLKGETYIKEKTNERKETKG